MKRKSRGLGLNDVVWVLELLVIGLLGLRLGVAMGLWEFLVHGSQLWAVEIEREITNSGG